ncbi:MAG: glyoxalase [Solirubrobacteraceae bacterium]|nr:glyoxalase [Solirubrobacteraceae bacterium]
MSSPAHPGRKLFLNLPVENVARSKAFFASLGFTFNPAFEDEQSTCMLVGEDAFVMLLEHEKFNGFAPLPVADPRTHVIGLYCFSVDTSEEVDTVTDAAIAAGGVDHGDPQDYGFMRSRSFNDLDGHGWQVMWMDPASAAAGPEEYAASQA